MRKPRDRKEASVKRFASITFDGVLAASDRDAVVRSLVSGGASPTSWSDAAGRTYALVALARDAEPLAAPAGARIDEPPLAVLRVTPRAPRGVAELERVCGGPGTPGGVLAARSEADSLVVEVRPRVTRLATIVALIDAALAFDPGRTIEPLLPLDDESLAACASDLLAEPRLDATRLIETHLEALLGGGAQ
jgi:hypothetical protein